MLLNGLAAGLSLEEMRSMKFTHLQQMLWEWDDMHGADSVEVVEATSEDVMALTGL